MAENQGAPNAKGANDWGRTQTTWVKMRDLAVVDAAGAPVPFDLLSVTEGTIKGKEVYVFHLPDDRAFSADKARSSVAAQIARIGRLPPAGRYVIEKQKTKNAANTSGYDLILKAWVEPSAAAPSA